MAFYRPILSVIQKQTDPPSRFNPSLKFINCSTILANRKRTLFAVLSDLESLLSRKLFISSAKTKSPAF